MFTKTAEYYDALYHFKDYEEACNLLHQLIQKMKPSAKTLLDVACGTGLHLKYLSKNYVAEGLDLNGDLLKVAQGRGLGIKLHEADMTDFSLDKKFDVVTCLFSSIGYVKTVEKLNAAVRAMSNHLNPGGLLVVEPWIYPERYWKNRITANHYDGDSLKICWMYTSGYENFTSVFDINYMVGSPEGVSVFTEKHVMGLWTDEQYRNAFFESGISIEYEQEGFFGRGVYYGKK